MRRADRLFRIIQTLQRSKTTVTARDIAEELEVSERTIYRDIQDLMGNNVPIDGERGVGYLLRSGYDLPPMMFTDEEIDAILLGARMVETHGDPQLSRAARDVLTKIGNVLPVDRRTLLQAVRYLVPKFTPPPVIRVDMKDLRQAIRDQRKISISYEDGKGAMTSRTLWPLLTVFFDPVQILVGWCELRDGYRNFRIDRMSDMVLLDDHYRPPNKRELNDYLLSQREAG